MKHLAPLLWFALVAPSASAQTQTTTVTRATCIERMGERLGALAARDWSSLGRLAARDRRECVGKLDREAHTAIYGHVAMASFQLRDWKNTVANAQECVRYNYLAYSCHLYEAESLIELNRPAEAAAKLTSSEKLIAHLISEVAARKKELTDSAAREMNDVEGQSLDIASETTGLLRSKLALAK